MHANDSYEYAVIRVVPRVERAEFLNVGVIVFCRVRKFLEAQCKFDRSRIEGAFPGIDIEQIERHVRQIEAVCKGGKDAGPIGELPIHERFHWLVAPRSTIIQTSSAHSGLTDDPEQTLRDLVEALVP